jgi:thymidine kinase
MGPMFAGKSTELIRRIQRLEICDKKVLKIKFKMDDRYSQECISTHDSKKTKAMACFELKEVGEMWRNFDVIAVDEG